MSHPMPFFGYVSLILALVLCVYTLFAGTLALYALSHGRAEASLPTLSGLYCGTGCADSAPAPWNAYCEPA